MNPREFIGIYSFPKSGNTWLRAVVSEMFFGGDWSAVPDCYKNNIFDAPYVDLAGRRISFYKSHDKTPIGAFQGLPIRQTKYIYIVRHPLDVFLSQLNYFLLKPESVADQSLRPPASGPFSIPCSGVDQALQDGSLDLFFKAFVVYGTLQPQFARSGSWMDNVSSWLPRPNTLVLRYEDMISDRARALDGLADFLTTDRQRVYAAAERAEQSTRKDGHFFWKKSAGNFKQYLSDEQVALFRRHHGDIVARAGY